MPVLNLIYNIDDNKDLLTKDVVNYINSLQIMKLF